jgi:hypothetical protein
MATRLPQKTFDYSGLPAEEAQELRKIGARVSKLARMTMTLGIEIGNQLARGKKILGFGNFGGWCETLGHSGRMAEIYMSIAHFAAEHGRDAVEGLSIAAVAALAAPSTPQEVVIEVLCEAKSGGRLTTHEIRVRIMGAKTGSKVNKAAKHIDEAEVLEIFKILQPLQSASLRRVTDFLERADNVAILALYKKIDEYLAEPRLTSEVI